MEPLQSATYNPVSYTHLSESSTARSRYGKEIQTYHSSKTNYDINLRDPEFRFMNDKKGVYGYNYNYQVATAVSYTHLYGGSGQETYKLSDYESYIKPNYPAPPSNPGSYTHLIRRHLG